MKRLLTIQDISCFGECSTTVALPLVSACGVECAVLPPAILSNHTGPGFTTWSFADLTDEMPKIEAKWIEQHIRFDAFYTGYVCEQHIEPILSILKTCANEGAIKFIDPAMADDGVMYPGFAADFPEKIKRLCAEADYLLPNLTEAAFLTGDDPAFGMGTRKLTREDVERLIGNLHKLGPKHVVLTGVSFEEGLLGTAVSDGKTIVYDFNVKNPRKSHGTGDMFASIFAGGVMRGKTPVEAAAIAADVICAAIELTEVDHWHGISFERAIPLLVEKMA